ATPGVARCDLVSMVVAIALVVLLLVVALIAIRRWRKLPLTSDRAVERTGVIPIPGHVERGPPLPVVLVHGLFGFDRIGVPGARFDYFRGIARHLENLGCHAHAVRLPGAASGA